MFRKDFLEIHLPLADLGFPLENERPVGIPVLQQEAPPAALGGHVEELALVWGAGSRRSWWQRRAQLGATSPNVCGDGCKQRDCRSGARTPNPTLWLWAVPSHGVFCEPPAVLAAGKPAPGGTVLERAGLGWNVLIFLIKEEIGFCLKPCWCLAALAGLRDSPQTLLG